MKTLLIRLSSSALLAATLGAGIVHAANISDAGPHSNNQIFASDHSSFNQSNNSSVNVSNDNHQSAQSGDAIVSGNTHGGNATSGDASNSNRTSTNVDVSNGSGCCTSPVWNGDNSISNTGPHSNNQIFADASSSVKISNNTNVNVSNQNSQTAQSGDAIVEGNTWGGSATSGNASNFNSTSTSVHISSSFATAEPVFESDGRGNGQVCGNCQSPDQHQWHRQFPCCLDQGLHSDNPCFVTSEFAGSKNRDRDDSDCFRCFREPVFNHNPCRRKLDRNEHSGPCPVIGRPIIRPPCLPVFVPCRPIVRPCHPVVVPCHPVAPPCCRANIPCHPVAPPCHRVKLPCHRVVTPCHPVVVPCHKQIKCDWRHQNHQNW